MPARGYADFCNQCGMTHHNTGGAGDCTIESGGGKLRPSVHSFTLTGPLMIRCFKPCHLDDLDTLGCSLNVDQSNPCAPHVALGREHCTTATGREVYHTSGPAIGGDAALIFTSTPWRGFCNSNFTEKSPAEAEGPEFKANLSRP